MKRIAISCLLALSGMPAVSLADAGGHIFNLSGGHFFGPGPIVPDTPLPDGSIRGIDFDLVKQSGAAAYAADGRLLSDGETAINANIDAGALEIGGEQVKGKSAGKTFWLYAVAGGPNSGPGALPFRQ